MLLNILNVPGFNQHRKHVIAEFHSFVHHEANFLVPVPAVFEAGNHIAKLPDGRVRRKYAEILCDQVRKALNEEAPWVLIPLPDLVALAEYLSSFPDCAMREVGMVDLSIIEVWKDAQERHQAQRVCIWSLDGQLQGYDYNP